MRKNIFAVNSCALLLIASKISMMDIKKLKDILVEEF